MQANNTALDSDVNRFCAQFGYLISFDHIINEKYTQAGQPEPALQPQIALAPEIPFPEGEGSGDEGQKS